MAVQEGFLGNNTGVTGMGDFGDMLSESCVYPKFGHMENMMMGGMEKLLVDEFISESVDHDHDAW